MFNAAYDISSVEAASKYTLPLIYLLDVCIHVQSFDFAYWLSFKAIDHFALPVSFGIALFIYSMAVFCTMGKWLLLISMDLIRFDSILGLVFVFKLACRMPSNVACVGGGYGVI